MFVASYIETASHLFEQYELQMPLPLYLRSFFRNNHKFGSRDRNYIAELVYGIYRLGPQSQTIPVRDKLLVGSLLSGRLPKLFYEKCDKAYAEIYDQSFAEKIEWAYRHHGIQVRVPGLLSEGISEEHFLAHLFSKPNMFIRIRKNRRKILDLLDQAGIAYTIIRENVLSMDVRSGIDRILPSPDYVVQDFASQQIGDYLTPVSNEKWWDCCAGSGGKSILLLDKNPNIQLTVTDIRENILHNLSGRMKVYGYEHAYRPYCLDVSQTAFTVNGSPFDAVLADVPCSGSGNWNRSPEQFYFFTTKRFEHFSGLQQQIARNAVANCATGGTIYYITCSVFRQENEQVVEGLLANGQASLVAQHILDAAKVGGDYMFIAVMKKN